MAKNIKNTNNIKYNTRFGVLGMMLVFFSTHTPALAMDDPFAMDSAHWMSFEHYKDADKRGILPAPPPPPAVETPAETTPVANAAPVTAGLARPIDLPVMPGMNKGFMVHVNSTVEDHPAPAETRPVAAISDKNWQSPVSVQTAKRNGDGSDEDADIPLSVRLSYLPNKKITPIPSPDRPSAQKLGHVVLEKILAARAAAPKTQAEAAACAAIDAYKKQQLSALQSDRETLSALQDAIHSLGLDKQLNFMQGNDSALNVSGAIDAVTTVR